MFKLPLTMGLACILLAGCSTPGYRCPLDPGDKPDSATACLGMTNAMDGAKRGAGGRTSVLIDDQGRLVPSGLMEKAPAVPLAQQMRGTVEPYRDASGAPVYEPSQVFRSWTRAFIDADGNLHEGSHTWFTTPGRWSYGSLEHSGGASGDQDNIMRPGMPKDQGPATRQAKPAAPAATQATPEPAKDKDKAALQALSSSVAARTTAGQPSGTSPVGQSGASVSAMKPAITPPAVNLAN